ncbi:MAG: GAF domain-containing protein [Bacteroidetes bacterium]|nr:MAG: GAF domain-containing protein [Bacteroidota bacterium]
MEELHLNTGSKRERYAELIPQIAALVRDEPNAVANMANIAAALKESFTDISWVGFYLYDPGTDGLVLGPFQGKIACTRIGRGKGVCGAAFERNETIIVPDVEKFPGHIYCDGGTRSEIVVPLRSGGLPVGVLDVDSYRLAAFDATDAEALESLIAAVAGTIVRTE